MNHENLNHLNLSNPGFFSTDSIPSTSRSESSHNSTNAKRSGVDTFLDSRFPDFVPPDPIPSTSAGAGSPNSSTNAKRSRLELSTPSQSPIDSTSKSLGSQDSNYIAKKARLDLPTPPPPPPEIPLENHEQTLEKQVSELETEIERLKKLIEDMGDASKIHKDLEKPSTSSIPIVGESGEVQQTLIVNGNLNIFY